MFVAPHFFATKLRAYVRALCLSLVLLTSAHHAEAANTDEALLGHAAFKFPAAHSPLSCGAYGSIVIVEWAEGYEGEALVAKILGDSPYCELWDEHEDGATLARVSSRILKEAVVDDEPARASSGSASASSSSSSSSGYPLSHGATFSGSGSASPETGRNRVPPLRLLDLSSASDASRGVRQQLPRSARMAEAERECRLQAHAAALGVAPRMLGFWHSKSRNASVMVMERIEGRTLKDWLANVEATPAQLVTMAANLASAVATLHGAELIHRDLHPANIMVTADLAVKIIDFGLACLPSAGRDENCEPTVLHGVHVRQPYAAPEIALSEPDDGGAVGASFAADAYALGVMLGEILADALDVPEVLARLTDEDPDARATAQDAALVLKDASGEVLTPAGDLWSGALRRDGRTVR